MAIDRIIAGRIHTITVRGWAYPEEAGEVGCEPCEWRPLSTMPYQAAPPQEPPPLRDMVRSLAPLGGFFTRKGDGEPGITSIWQGDQRLHAFIDAGEPHRTVGGL
jgi:hypothetical protein